MQMESVHNNTFSKSPASSLYIKGSISEQPLAWQLSCSQPCRESFLRVWQLCCSTLCTLRKSRFVVPHLWPSALLFSEDQPSACSPRASLWEHRAPTLPTTWLGAQHVLRSRLAGCAPSPKGTSVLIKEGTNLLLIVCESEQQIREAVLESGSSVDHSLPEVALFLFPFISPWVASDAQVFLSNAHWSSSFLHFYWFIPGFFQTHSLSSLR